MLTVEEVGGLMDVEVEESSDATEMSSIAMASSAPLPQNPKNVNFFVFKS